MGVYSPKQVGPGGGVLLWWSWCLLTLQLSGRWKLLWLRQWLARKVSIDTVQNPISFRTLLSCCMPLLWCLHRQGAHGR